MLFPIAAREGRGDERLTCIIGVGEPCVDRGKDFVLNLALGFLFLLTLLLIEPADIVLVDIDNTTDDVAVALSGEAVIYDGEGILLYLPTIQNACSSKYADLFPEHALYLPTIQNACSSSDKYYSV